MGYYKELGVSLQGGNARNVFGAGGNVIEIDRGEYNRLLSFFDRMRDSLDPRWVKKTLRRNSNPIVAEMKARSHSSSIMGMIGVTTAVKRAGPFGVRVGVIKNDPSLFPKFSAQALASVLEYGTDERFAQVRRYGVTVGVKSTGEMPAYPFLNPAWFSGIVPMMSKTEKLILKRVPT